MKETVNERLDRLEGTLSLLVRYLAYGIKINNSKKQKKRKKSK